MEAINRFANDISSWYWWMSVVFVGLAINLASSYVKPIMDRKFESRSKKRRIAREEKDHKFDEKTTEISSDPILLVLAGQKAFQGQMRTNLEMAVLGINIVILFVVILLPEPKGYLHTILMASLIFLVPIKLLSLLNALKDESSSTDLYQVACEKYKSEARQKN